MMLNEIYREINKMTPLSISTVSWEGEQLVIGGDSWNIVFATCWWRVLKDEVLVFGCTDNNADKIKEIKGSNINKIEIQSKLINSDLVLILANGWIIETFSTSSLEPWSLTINKQTFFSNPSMPQWDT
ncbi:MAG TPA: hypothetical protein VFI06_03005 [Chitinophagaceae bacterium]|nr:hypothetical protein [Chitinophagaceae bacterium]